MGNSIQEEIHKKKLKLESDLVKIQENLDESLESAKNITSTYTPREIIKKHPLPAIGLSIITGFVLGGVKSKSHKSKSIAYKSESVVRRVLADELKKRLIIKGIALLFEIIESKIPSSKR